MERADAVVGPWSVHLLEIAPELTDADVAKLQDDDEVLGPVKTMLSQGYSPTLDDLRALPLEGQKLWSLRPTIILQNQVLVRRDGDAVQLVVPQSLRRQLFTHTHAGPLVAHLGFQRIVAQLRRLYYWPGMRKDIDAWCKQCEGCAISRRPPSRPHGHLRKVSAGAPMDLVAIDILSGLPAKADGYQYLLVATDYFTKWLEAIPSCDAEAQTCMRALYRALFSRFGLPRQLHSDQGSNFDSKLVAELCWIAGINKTRTTPFHPRSGGQTERANRTILQMLRASIDAQPESWPDRLRVAAYRMTLHSVTGISPNMAIMGREVFLPASLIVQPPEEPVAVTTSFAADFRQNTRNAHASVRSATSCAAKTQKNYFDKHVKGPSLALNQIVWLY